MISLGLFEIFGASVAIECVSLVIYWALLRRISEKVQGPKFVRNEKMTLYWSKISLLWTFCKFGPVIVNRATE